MAQSSSALWVSPSRVFGSVNLSNATCRGWVSFAETSIEKGLFGGTEFRDEVTFWPAIFNEDAYFQFAKFRGECTFREGLFSCYSDFAAAEFDGPTVFDRVTFAQDVIFSGCKIGGRVEFSADRGDGCFQQACEFAGVTLKAHAVIVFEGVDLSLATFLWTNVEQFVFVDVVWKRLKSRIEWLGRSRLALNDEFAGSESKEPEYGLVALNYRQLVRNYERERDYETAEDFYIGEMEARRKQFGRPRKGWRRTMKQWLNSYAIYSILSHYGSSYLQSLASLAVLSLVAAVLLLYVGFQPSSSTAIPGVTSQDGGTAAVLAQRIQYSVLADAQHPKLASPLEWLHDYGQAIVFVGSVLTLQQRRPYDPIDSVGWLGMYLVWIALVGQTALVLFAVRRRFRR